MRKDTRFRFGVIVLSSTVFTALCIWLVWSFVNWEWQSIPAWTAGERSMFIFLVSMLVFPVSMLAGLLFCTPEQP